MHTFRNLFLFCTAATLPLGGFAQQGPNANRQTPPKLERLDEGEQPAVTIQPPRERSKITEQRLPGGRRTEIHVNSGGSKYVVQPGDRIGNVQPGDAQSMSSRPARWEILRFEANRPQQTPQSTTNVPPPPPLPESNNNNGSPARK